MAEIVYKGFTGEQPRVEPHLLPPSAAQLALNCEFESGALVPTLGGLVLTTVVSNPCKGLYTEDGINFFSWTVEAQAFRSPVINDAYGRMFFLKPSDGVASAGLLAEMTPFGPTPLTTFALGVPQPTLAPVLSLIDRATLPEYPAAALSAEAWWESVGKQYGRAAVVLTPVTAFKSYTFPTPAIPGGTPADAVLVVQFKIKDGSNTLVSATARIGTTARSSGLPGGLEIDLTGAAPTATIALTWGVTETRAYTYIWENTWGEQGAAAPPATIAPTYLQDVQVVVGASSNGSYRPIALTRVFRTYGTGAAYIETVVTGTNPTYLDASRVASSVLGALQSVDWYPPPAALAGWCASPNGWLAAFKGNNLHLSEPYRPHAWPYVHKFPHAIRGIYPTRQALVVTTAAGVYLLMGTNPVGTSQFQLSLPQPGLSQRSMAEIEGAVAYASNDGFALVAGSDATMLASQKLFTRKVWRAAYGDILADASMRFAYYDGNLLVTSSTQPKGFALRLDEDVGAYSRLDTRMELTQLLPVNDALYYTVANTVYQFRAGAVQAFDWRGKDFVFAAPATFGAGFIRCDGAVTLTLYAKDVQVWQGSVSDGYFRLPDLNAELRWSVRLAGTFRVRELALAHTMGDLKRV